MDNNITGKTVKEKEDAELLFDLQLCGVLELNVTILQKLFTKSYTNFVDVSFVNTCKKNTNKERTR